MWHTVQVQCPDDEIHFCVNSIPYYTSYDHMEPYEQNVLTFGEIHYLIVGIMPLFQLSPLQRCPI